MTNKNQNNEPPDIKKCYHCGKPAIKVFDDGIDLCLECYLKVTLADSLRQQSFHNKQSWAAELYNIFDQQFHQSTGGLLPLKQINIPEPPAGNYYSDNSIRVSNSSVGIVNSGTLSTINTSIDFLNNQGNQEISQQIKELIEGIYSDVEMADANKKQIVELLQIITTEITQNNEKQDKSMISHVIDQLNKLIPTTASTWIIWEKFLTLIQF